MENSTADIEALNFENRLLKRLLTHTDTYLAYLDTGFRFLYANKAYIQGSGYSEEELVGHNHFDLFPDEENRRIFTQARDTGITVEYRAKSFEYKNQPEKGTTYWDWMLTPVKGEQGTVEGLVLSLNDVTRRIVAEQEREKSEERYRLLFESTLHGIAFHEIITDAGGNPVDYRFLEVNRVFEGLTGLRKETIIGRTVREVLPGIENDPADWIGTYGKVALHGATIRFEQYSESLHKWFSISAFSPKAGQFCAVFDDITDQKRLEEQIRSRAAELAEANRELEAFTYSVSHDLRAPLRTMKGFIHILEADYSDRLDEEGRLFVEKIRNAGSRMDAIIGDLLHLSRVTRQEMVRKAVNLSELARSIVSELRESQPGRDVEIVVAENVVADADPKLIHSALTNLIGNAWKYTDKTPHARIEFGESETGEGRAFYIRDNGAGFDMQYADRLFMPFNRLHSEREFPGTGIGLAIVKRIIERHGGRIWAESAVGEGSTFWFTLST